MPFKFPSGKALGLTKFRADGKIKPTEAPQSYIPTEGLLCHLSAVSYKDGQPWYDDIQGIPFNVVSTAPTRTTIGSIPCIQFNASGYFECSTADGERIDMTGEFTVIMIVNLSSPPSRRTIIEKAGNAQTSYRQELACTYETSTAISYYNGAGDSDYDYGSSAPRALGSWAVWALKMHANRDIAEYWVGNGWSGNSQTNRTNQPITRAGALRIGSGYAGPIHPNNYVHSVLVYGNALNTSTMQEVCNYYQNLFSMFGGSITT